MTRCQALILALGLVGGGLAAAWGPPAAHEGEARSFAGLPALTLEDAPFPPPRTQQRIYILDV